MYERLVVGASAKLRCLSATDRPRSSQAENPEDAPDLVIAADTVVVKGEEILEKPKDAQDNLRMIADLNDSDVRISPRAALPHR